MKKISNKMKLFLKKRAKKLDKRRISSILFKKSKKRNFSHYKTKYSSSIDHKGAASRRKYISIPNTLCMTNNISETLKFFGDHRRLSTAQRGKIYTDFQTLKSITPEAALLLVAEMDQMLTRYKLKAAAREIERWDAQVIKILYDIGMFQFLKVRHPDLKPFLTNDSGDLKYIKVKSGLVADGTIARKLREDIEEILSINDENKSHLFTSISEAMTNVVHHAYPDRDKSILDRNSSKFWMLGSYNRTLEELYIIFYDRGIGIPNSLDRKTSSEWASHLFNEKFKRLFEIIYGKTRSGDAPPIWNDHAGKIRLAFEMGRSRTGEEHRGKGLHDLLTLLSSKPGNKLLVMSGFGSYLCEVEESGALRESLGQHAPKLEGTLLSWHLKP